MAPILTTRQAEELHKSIIAYLAANGLTNTAAALRQELNLSESAFDTDTAKKYETLLEKKWTSVVRLQKKIMELETRSASLQSELDNVSPAFLAKRNQEPASWLPRSPPRHSLESHRDTVNAVAFHPVFSSLASGSEDCTIKIWDWEFGELERTIKAHTQGVRDVDFGGPKGNVLLASCSVDMSIKLWDPADGYKNTRTLKGHDHTVNTVRFIPGGNLLVSASGDKTLRIWDTSTGFCIKTIEGHTGWVRDVYPSIDGRWLLSTGNDQAVRLWDVSSSPNPKNTLSLFGHENVITCCALAPPTSYQYFAPLAGLKHPPSWSSTAEFMASGGRDKTIKLWDARGNCLATLVGHDNWVSAIVFHPGGKYLLSASDDKTVRCWDLSQEGKCVKVIGDTHEQFITALRWADGPAVEGANGGGGGGGGGGGAGGGGAGGGRGGGGGGGGGGQGSGGDTKGDAASGGQIRCVIATASMDTTVRIFAS